MREVIYYPGFEVRDENWLKFALLFLDKLNPIIPHTGDAQLSESFRRLQDESDLISIHRPSVEEGDRATLDALEKIEAVLKHPERFGNVFKTTNIAKTWTRKKRQKIELFRDKYTSHFEDFCLENKMGQPSNHGVLVSPELANVYMTVLAHAIADSRGLPPITDYRSLDRYAVFSRVAKPREREVLETAQSIFELKLPGNLADISIDEVIQHRNSRGFKETQREFHTALTNFLDAAEHGAGANTFATSLGSIWRDFSDEVLKIGTGVTAFGLGIWLVLEAGAAEPLNAVRDVLSGASLSVGSIISIRNTWSNTKTNRYARRYMTNLKNLKLDKSVSKWS